MRGDFHPDESAVHSMKAEQIVPDRAFGEQSAEKGGASRRIHKPFRRKRRYAIGWRARWVAEHGFEIWIDSLGLPLGQ